MDPEEDFRRVVAEIEHGGIRARLLFLERYVFLHRTRPDLAKKFFDVVSEHLPEHYREAVFDALERLLQR